MNRTEFMSFHDECTAKMKSLCTAKNADYAGPQEENPFANFCLVETAYQVTSTEVGLFTRLSDKFARVASFVKVGFLRVSDESVEDTLLDIANYCILFAGYLRSKREPGLSNHPATVLIIPATRPLVVEHGKKYIDGHGQTVGPMEGGPDYFIGSLGGGNMIVDNDGTVSIRGWSRGWTYRKDGKWDGGNEKQVANNLVRELSE